MKKCVCGVGEGSAIFHFLVRTVDRVVFLSSEELKMSEEHSVSCECSVTSESPFCRVSLLPQNFHSSVWEGGGGGLSEEASSPFKRRSLVSVCLSQIAGPEPGLRHLCCFCSGSHGDFADDRESWIWGEGVLGCWLCSSLALYLSHGLLN